MRVRIARDELRRLRELTAAINRLECEITGVIVTRARGHPAHARLHRPPPQRRQDHPRGDPLPEALPRPARLAASPTADLVREISQSLD
jgi:hypothetical protein